MPLLRNANGLLQTASGLASSECGGDCLPGACCAGGNCLQMSQTACAEAGGTFYGCDTPCDGIDCGGPTLPLCCTNGARCAYEFPLSFDFHWELTGNYRWDNDPSGGCAPMVTPYSFNITENYTLPGITANPASACSDSTTGLNGPATATSPSLFGGCPSLVFNRRIKLADAQIVSVAPGGVITTRPLWALLCFQLALTPVTFAYRFFVFFSTAAGAFIGGTVALTHESADLTCGNFILPSTFAQSAVAPCGFRTADMTTSASLVVTPNTQCGGGLAFLP